MTLPIEILVHVSGPSRGPDDARYRKEAQEFLSFEPASTHHLYTGANGLHLKHPHTIDNLRETFLHNLKKTTPAPSAQTIRPSSRTPALLGENIHHALPWTATHETPKLLIERTPALPRPRTAPNASTSSQEAPTLRRTQSDSWQTPPSVIPDSQPTPKPNDSPRLFSSPYLKSPFESSSPSPTHHSSPTAKHARVQVTSSPPTAPDRPTSLALPTCPPPIQTSIPASTSPAPSLPLEIHPPRPRPSTSHFTTHLTPSLLTISTKLPLSKYFTPQLRTRTLDALERGHWLIPLSTWDEALITRFWRFLVGFVGEGRAGWGVWCVREMQMRPGLNSGSSKENHSPVEREEVVKIYCWGEVVGEVWLMLFLASDRRIKGVGARWVDAGGGVVVRMVG